MFDTLTDSLNKWNSTKTERQKLQHGYIIITIVIILFAGIISLFNAGLGHKIVLIAVASFSTFIINGIIWNLLKSSLIEKLSSKPRKK